jgi:hypothetical protein
VATIETNAGEVERRLVAGGLSRPVCSGALARLEPDHLPEIQRRTPTTRTHASDERKLCSCPQRLDGNLLPCVRPCPFV